ncbi:hypothetical protein VSS74_23555 [Conexibacter stalactiti]|uniref:Uncharacterized protein n=1 Tax=Conexibacter stalactiti TaxID=1940611 RepID=A0ABU4HWW9_9ACTN|nr:hypothetical protein [Conexibacter stalactiti]MDW5597344.1 hypothetical protein [Conexibacter stalactiti]MEC5037986.1 hypothetical protein [Conexibacter stalactiti]
MSWSDPDVTPVGGAPGARAELPRPVAGESGFPAGEDPFGSRPSVQRRGWIRLVLGVVLLVGGIAGLAVGIVQAVGAHGRIEGDAVGRGIVREGGRGGALAFEVPPGERRHYTVYLLFEGLFSNDEVQELAVRDTGCLATMPDGVQTAFRGARQGVAATLGNAASVGHFSSQPGRVTIACAYTSGTRSSERRRPGAVAFVVTPGTPSWVGSGVLTILGGVAAGLLGGFLAVWGWRGRRRIVG